LTQKNHCESTMRMKHQVSFAAYPAQIGAFVILHAGARAIAGAQHRSGASCQRAAQRVLLFGGREIKI
jgi:hypothetical protein